MPPQLRSASLTYFDEVARQCGLDGRALVVEVGLPSRCLTEPDLMIPAHVVARVLELAAERANEPALGLRMAASRRLSNLGPLGLLMRDQPTLRHALEKLAAHIHVHNEAFALEMVEAGDLTCIRGDVLLNRNVPRQQALEAAMGISFRIMQVFLGETWHPKQVNFRHPAPAHVGWYRQVFGSTVQFGSAFNEIVCAARDLDVPNPGADPVMAAYSQKLLDQDTSPRASMADRVRRLVAVLLPRGLCKANVVAQHLGVARRTLDNRLGFEGTTFKVLVDGMRRDLLASYLQEKTLALTDIAPLLGFSELSAFSRWHRAQFGGSVTSFRPKKRFQRDNPVSAVFIQTV